ncbi:AAA-ATPase At3g28580-like [Tripterygium wilfordii]|uniref:AAA-ATPase At3g28580-like n=1 Tax=Tripterygium wilfordii TaxID=458696 RepID=UPI0018F840BE|nr:AAA-ATPase At3g28580-like [Tripterygium wilfordii]
MMTQLGSAVAGLMFIGAIFRDHFPPQIVGFIRRYFHRWLNLFNPYIQITFPELAGERLKRSEAYSLIESYLSANSTLHAKRLKADDVKESKSIILSMDDQEEVVDEFNGIKVWWISIRNVTKTQSFSFYPASEEKRYYKLTFHKRDREVITGSYIDHVLTEGKATVAKNRQRKLFTNNPSENWRYYMANKWSHVVFEHPASFDTLAMEEKKKEEIKKDLIKFSQSKDYYTKIGKAWKRGYLLYGPPGTGKSTMITAMANLLNYDVYDLELTTVKDNTELKRLFMETTNKSIIVIEDIDCSLDLTGQRKEKEKKKDKDQENKEPNPQKEKEKEERKSKVTLSGLLNFIDGLWSACGGERIIIFTTNYVDKLDPALIRRGRMDKHIEMSYCCFEAFKLLAKNYLDIESHDLFPTIARLFEETKMTPADVAENLMPKSVDEDVEICLNRLIEAMEVAKEEEARKKSEEAALLKVENERLASTKEDVKDSEVSVKEVKENGVLDKEVSVKEGNGNGNGITH